MFIKKTAEKVDVDELSLYIHRYFRLRKHLRFSIFIYSAQISLVCVVPVDVVLVELVTVLLVLLPNTAVTLTVQLLPALREEMVCVVAVPLTVSDDVRFKPQKFKQE